MLILSSHLHTDFPDEPLPFILDKNFYIHFSLPISSSLIKLLCEKAPQCGTFFVFFMYQYSTYDLRWQIFSTPFPYTKLDSHIKQQESCVLWDYYFLNLSRINKFKYMKYSYVYLWHDVQFANTAHSPSTNTNNGKGVRFYELVNNDQCRCESQEIVFMFGSI
jgi:hypothetical protein